MLHSRFTVASFTRAEVMATASQIVSLALTLYASGSVLLVAFLWWNHSSFPLNLEAMEGTILEHVRRAYAGLPVYPEPSPEFVALAYNPGFYYLALPFVVLLGDSLFTLRIVAIVGAVGAMAVIYFAVRAASTSHWWGLMAAGLFAAGYRAMDTYLDNAHSDSWLLFTVLLGCFVLDRGRSQKAFLLGTGLLVAAFWLKQHGALFAIGGVIYLTVKHGWRAAWPSWALATLAGPVAYLGAASWPFGPAFHYFTWEVPSRWSEPGPRAVGRLALYAVRYFLFLLPLATWGFALSLGTWRRALVSTVPGGATSPAPAGGAAPPSGRTGIDVWRFMLPVSFVSALMGSMDPGSNNNVFVPLAVWLIIAGTLGLKALADRIEAVGERGVRAGLLVGSFALLAYNPAGVVVSPNASAAYADLTAYLRSLDGDVYAPWLGQLQDGYRLSPALHWVALQDLYRMPGSDDEDHPTIRWLLDPVVSTDGTEYILTHTRLEQDRLLAFLATRYELSEELGDRFSPLATLPKRFGPGWPRYLYRSTSKGR